MSNQPQYYSPWVQPSTSCSRLVLMMHDEGQHPFSFVCHASVALLPPIPAAPPCLAALVSTASFPTSLTEFVLLCPRNATVSLVLSNLSVFTFHSILLSSQLSHVSPTSLGTPKKKTVLISNLLCAGRQTISQTVQVFSVFFIFIFMRVFFSFYILNISVTKI